jgi:hypothetical protein
MQCQAFEEKGQNVSNVLYKIENTLRSLLNEQATLSEQGGIFLKNS